MNKILRLSLVVWVIFCKAHSSDINPSEKDFLTRVRSETLQVQKEAEDIRKKRKAREDLETAETVARPIIETEEQMSWGDVKNQVRVKWRDAQSQFRLDLLNEAIKAKYPLMDEEYEERRTLENLLKKETDEWRSLYAELIDNYISDEISDNSCYLMFEIDSTYYKKYVRADRDLCSKYFRFVHNLLEGSRTEEDSQTEEESTIPLPNEKTPAHVIHLLEWLKVFDSDPSRTTLPKFVSPGMILLSHFLNLQNGVEEAWSCFFKKALATLFTQGNEDIVHIPDIYEEALKFDPPAYYGFLSLLRKVKPKSWLVSYIPTITPDIARGYEEVYQIFLGGILIYRKGQHDEVRLPIAALANPLDGVFDLSRCGDTGNYLSIHTGYRKEKITYPNANPGYGTDRVEIWFAPRFLIERELSTTARQFQGVMGSWDARTAPIGIFWSWSVDSLEAMLFLTRESALDNSKNLEEKCRQASCSHAEMVPALRAVDGWGAATPLFRISQVFHVHFVN